MVSFLMDKQQLASKIWQSTSKMRSKVEANEYKDYIRGFIFYKFLSNKELKLLNAKGMTPAEIKALTEKKTEEVNYIKSKIGYFIAYNDLFSAWLEKDSGFSVDNVRTALSAFDRNISIAHKSDLLALIKDIPMDGKQDYDVLGFIYEYLIRNFAANAGKKAGEFYTPHEVSLLMSEIVAELIDKLRDNEFYMKGLGELQSLLRSGKK